jgi:hypothetical protein
MTAPQPSRTAGEVPRNSAREEKTVAVNGSYKDAPTRTVSVGGVDLAYRELGPKAGVPVIFLVHLAGNLDNWDPRVVDGIAARHRVFTFDNRGVGASTGKTVGVENPDSSCRGSVILVDQPSKHVPPADFSRADGLPVIGAVQRGGQLKRSVRSMSVVVLGVGLQHPVEVPTAEDQHPVQALGPDRADPPLGEGVRVRCSDRGEDHPRTVGAEHLVEGSRELRVPVVDQEPRLRCSVLQFHGEVPGLLGDPHRARVRRGGGEEHAP